MRMYLFYIFQAGLTALIVFAVAYAFLESTRPDPDPECAEDHEPA
jgi:hypothetical protein